MSDSEDYPEHFMDENTVLICKDCYKSISSARNFASATMSGAEVEITSNDWTKNTAHYYTDTGYPQQDGIKLRSPTWAMSTRLIVVNNLMLIEDVGFTGFPISVDQDFEDFEDDDEVLSFSVRFTRDEDDITATGYFDFSGYGEFRLPNGWKNLGSLADEKGILHDCDLVNSEFFEFVSDHMYEMAKVTEKAAGFWGNTPETAWVEEGVWHPSYEDMQAAQDIEEGIIDSRKASGCWH